MDIDALREMETIKRKTEILLARRAFMSIESMKIVCHCM